ncbi:MAG TPA: polymer-forming cytoskeletal protein [Rhodanobacter sp.]|jgi:cytoskeletal protein CcmA (bactofilin family)|nr:polymer-forming cytoskeletal protein [Rhodanobacter sp.]
MFRRKPSTRDPGSSDTSLIARGTVIRGEVHFTGALYLDGRIDGSVVATSDDALLTISEQGQVDGEIRVPQAVINGHVTGNVEVSARLQLAALARIDGDLRYNTLEMAAGAQVNGHIVRQAEPAPREADSPQATDPAVADDAVAA